jgi:RNA polymerase-interacting CarD/CdnL/TRCF family regulator
MYKIGDKVVYSSFGVMEIVDIRTEKVAAVSREYYILESICGLGCSQTFVPKDNDQLVSNMHPILTKSEMLDFIRKMESIPPLDWIADNRARSDRFKSLIESVDREAMISMIKLVRATAVRRAAEGKKNYLADENAMNKAQRLISSEISTVFEISEDEVASFVESNK